MRDVSPPARGQPRHLPPHPPRFSRLRRSETRRTPSGAHRKPSGARRKVERPSETDACWGRRRPAALLIRDFRRPPRPRQPWRPAGRWRAPPNQKFATPDDRLGDLRPLSVQRATRSTPCRALRSLAVLARSKPVDVRARAVPSKAKPAFHPCIQDPRRVAVQHMAPHRRLVEHPDNTVDRRSTPWLTMLNVPGASRSTASRRRRRHRPRARTA